MQYLNWDKFLYLDRVKDLPTRSIIQESLKKITKTFFVVLRIRRLGKLKKGRYLSLKLEPSISIRIH